jgi:hypothetical protein
MLHDRCHLRSLTENNGRIYWLETRRGDAKKIWLQDITLSNLVLEGGRTGLLINEGSSVELQNSTTLDQNLQPLPHILQLPGVSP